MQLKEAKARNVELEIRYTNLEGEASTGFTMPPILAVSTVF
jgi:hypothetical protein